MPTNPDPKTTMEKLIPYAIGAAVAVWLMAIGAVIWAVSHFVIKFW